MDAWERMFIGGEEITLFSIQEEMADMEQQYITLLQEEALRDYEATHGAMGTGPAIVVMLAQLALELAQIRQQLEVFSKRLEES